MVTRTVKYSLGVLGVLIVALLIAPFFIDVESYKSKITGAVEDATGRRMEIGAIEASLFPWVGVRLENVTLANRAGFSDRDFLKVESLDVKVALLPLLSSEVEIKQFMLVAPEVFLERNAEGAGNWEDLVAADQPAEADGSPVSADVPKQKEDQQGAALAALKIESMQLTRGKLIWADAASSSRTELDDITVEINDVQFDRPVDVSASVKLGDDSVVMKAQVGPIGGPAKLDVAKLPLQATLAADSLSLKPLAGMLPELPESIGNAESARLRLDVKLEQRPDGLRLSAGSVAFIGAVTAEGKWKAEMTGNKSVRLQEVGLDINGQSLFNAKGEISLGSRLKYQVRIEGENITRKWLAGFMPDLNVMYAGNSAPWEQLRLGALIAGDAERLELRDMQLMLDREIVQASGVVSFGKVPDIRLRLNSNELHLDPWLPKPKEQKRAAATVESELKTATSKPKSQEPDLRGFSNLRISSQMQIDTLHLQGLKMEHLRASLNGSHGQFVLDPLRFDLSGGQVTEKASLNLSVYPAKWTESVHMTGVSIGPVLRAVADMDMLEGVLQMDTDLKATGLLPDTATQNLNGKGKVLLRDGSVKGFDIAGTLRNLTAPGQAKGPEKTDFAQLQGSFSITKGVVKNDDLFMASPVFRLSGNGVINLPKSSMDYHVKPKLVGTLVGQGDTVTVRKGLSVPLRIRGPFKNLKITPEVDPASLIESIDAMKGGKALQGIQEIIKGEKPAQEQQGEQGQKSPPPPEEKIRKTLEGLGF